MPDKLIDSVRDLTPAFSVVLLILIESLPLRVPYLPHIAPALSLIAVFHWAIFRPETMPAWLIFLLGLLHDLLSGAPLGFMVLVFVLMQGVCMSQRRWFLTTSFAIGWLLFGLIAAGTALVGWLVAQLYLLAFIDPLPIALRALITIAVYPPVSWLLGRTERRLWAAA